MPSAATNFVAIAVFGFGLAAANGIGLAPAPEEFIGLKWGSSKEEVKAAMKEKGTNTMPRFTNDTHQAFSGGSAAGLAVEFWDLSFVNDEFWQGIVTFKDGSALDDLFKQVKKILTDKYGTRQSETFRPSDPSAGWHIVNPGSKEGVVIRLFMQKKSGAKKVRLEYVNETLRKLAPAIVPKAVDDGL